MEKISNKFFESRLLFISLTIKIIRQSRTLLPYILHRLIFVIRNFFNRPTLYPYELKYKFDNDTNNILDNIKYSLNKKGILKSISWENIYQREQHAKIIINQIKKSTDIVKVKLSDSINDFILKNGYIKLKDYKISKEKIRDVLNYLTNQKVYPSHYHHFSIKKKSNIKNIKHKYPFGSYDLQTILKAPHILKIITDKRILSIVSKYFGCWPTIHSVNLFWSFISHKKSGAQHFHRDVDDYKTLTLFINLTQTNYDDGAHSYIKGTHSLKSIEKIFDNKKNINLPKSINPFNKKGLSIEDFFNLPLNGYSFDKLYKHYFKENILFFYGDEGSAIITDNYGLHRGIKPKIRDRLVLWVSYSLLSNASDVVSAKLPKRLKYNEKESLIENNRYNKYVLRNLIYFD